MEFVTWQDKADCENSHCPGHAEGWAVSPGTLIKILDEETGE